jgi:anti-sigma factor ChrR (cupin superfamily)
MKNPGLSDIYAGYVLDKLSETERTEVAAEIAASPELAREVALLRQALAAWAEERVGESAPSPDLRRRLLRTVGSSERFNPFVALLRRLFDLGAEATAELLGKVDGAGPWTEAAPGVRYFHFASGPARAAFEAGIVRIRPEATFPRHRHRGPEVTLVLEGILLDRGQSHAAGAVVESDAGTEHDYQAGAGRDLIVASLHSGIDFL